MYPDPRALGHAGYNVLAGCPGFFLRPFFIFGTQGILRPLLPLFTPLALSLSTPFSQTRTMSSKLVVVFMFLALMRALAQTVITLAGGSTSGTTLGSINGVGTAALFFNPFGVAVDTSGNVIVSDNNNHKIRLIYPNRTVITLAGGNTTGTSSGNINGVGTAALFSNPSSIAVDTSGNVIVADTSNSKIRLIYPNRTVITLAGGSLTGSLAGSNNGVGTAALFNTPRGVAVDTSSNVIVADYNNHRIRLIYPNRTVITLAGTTSGNINGVGTAALFYLPEGVAVDTSGNVIVADHLNHKIRLIYPNRTVITLAGGNTTGTTSGNINGVGTAALFTQPRGVAVDTSGNVFVADHVNHKLRLVYPNRTVITLAGGSTTGILSGNINGVGTAALFSLPLGIALDNFGNVIVADTSNSKIRLIYPFTCSPGTYANFTSRSCILCFPGSFSSTSMASSCSPCAAGTFAQPFGSTFCEACPGGHYCPLGASKPEACGAGAFCPPGSFFPTSCPPLGYIDVTLGPANGPAFDVDTAACYNHCFFGGNGQTSKC